MTELERALVLLGHELEVPVIPGTIARTVRERIARRRRVRRGLVLALAVGVAALAVAFAVPSARTAILRFFHIGAVTVERVHTLPHATRMMLTSGLGEPLVREDAEMEAGFSAQLGRLKAPATWWAREGLLATILPRQPRVLLVEVRGQQSWLAKKVATDLQPVVVNGSFGYWIPGPHVLMYEPRPTQVEEVARYSGSALLWERNGITYRLQGEPTRAAALAEARKITP
jgi:hypothetical protein